MKTQTMKIERESELRLMGSALGSHRVAGQALIMMLSLLQERGERVGYRGGERETLGYVSVLLMMPYMRQTNTHTHTKTPPPPLLHCHSDTPKSLPVIHLRLWGEWERGKRGVACYTLP